MARSAFRISVRRTLLSTSVSLNGNGAAMYDIGLMYEKGESVGQNYKEAMRWYQKAADKGREWAIYKLGVGYRDGLGRVISYQSTLLSFRCAVSRGAVWRLLPRLLLPELRCLLPPASRS